MPDILTVTWAAPLPRAIIHEIATRHGVDPILIAAICMQESAGRKYAQRFEPGYRWFYKADVYAKKLGCSFATEIAGQQTSYGLMQVMGGVMRERGFEGWFGEAFDYPINIDIGVRHLANFLKKYDLEAAIASYNAGSPRYEAGSKAFRNQKYVDGVLSYLQRD